MELAQLEPIQMEDRHALDKSELRKDSPMRPCFACGHRQVRMVKTIESRDAYNQPVTVETKNFCDSCGDPKCFRYSDPAQTPSWRRI